MSRSRSFVSSIEPLESRIAPALLINGANLLGGGSPATGESSAGGNSATIVKVISGQAVVWYQDNQIVGISVGPNANLEILGDVHGDIVANLTAAGRLSDSDNDPLNGEDGAVLLSNNILGIKTTPLGNEKGSVQNIITAGSVANVNVRGELNGLYAGDGVFDPISHELVNGKVTSTLGGLDFNPIEPGQQTDFVFKKTDAQTIDTARKLTGILPGAGITNVTVGKAVELQMFAGSGNPNDTPLATAKTVAGGSIRTVTIESAFTNSGGQSSDPTPGYELHAGVGSSGLIGGAGGTIDKVTEKTSTSKVVAIAGNGGSGSSGAGGAGGNISNFDAGSDSSRYFLTAGNGGSGIPGGAGGSLITNNFANRSQIGGIVVSGDFDGQAGEDVIIINQGTGEMIVEANDGTGVNFTKVTQHTSGTDPVTIVSGVGSTPVSAYGTDVNNDGKLDLVVAYKNSNSLSVFLNQGGGVFWDATANGGSGGYNTISVSLTFSPSKIVESGGHIVVAENTADGKSALHLLDQTVDNTTGILTYEAENGLNALTTPVVDMVALSDGSIIVATADGGLRRASISGTPDGKPFDVSGAPLQTVPSGVTDLDVDSSGTHLVALSTAGHAFYTYTFDLAASTGPLTLTASKTDLLVKPTQVHYINDGDSATADPIAVLENVPNGSRVDVFSQVTTDSGIGFATLKTVSTKTTLKSFEVVYSKGNDAGFAAISSSLSQFTFSDGFSGTSDYGLPFASKSVQATAGNGGAGINLQPTTGALKVGNGGAGGSIISFNAEANEMTLVAGNGGNTVTGAGGAGGSINNPVIANAPATADKPAVQAVQLFLHTDTALSLKAGDGGSPSTAGTATASGGLGGSLTNLNIEVGSGDLSLASGIGGDSRGGAAGAGGNIINISSLLHQGNLTVAAGHGGEAFLSAVPAKGPATSGVGGAGGSVTTLKHELRLEADVESTEVPYFVKIDAGYGGRSVTAAGGNGGGVTGVTLKLDEANMTFDSGIDANNDGFDDQPGLHTDSTLTTTITTGYGGDGAKGGNGGALTTLKFDVVLDQKDKVGSVVVGPAVLLLKAGDGGKGTAGTGGNGGSITLGSPISGLSYRDVDATGSDPTNGQALLVKAGNGGSGSTIGGLGGDITGITAQNEIFVSGAVITGTQLTSATLQAGKGGAGGLGDGGRGGNIVNSLVGVQGGYLRALAGKGGDGGTTGDATTAKLAKGGAGGNVINGEFGLVSTNNAIGMLVQAGDAGSGYTAGGLGGSLTTLRINSSQSTFGASAILRAGDGGEAKLAAGVGGKGGDINSVSQAKDINSAISSIEAGNGGANLLGKAGAGGNVLNVKTVGFIGRPSDGVSNLGVIDTVGLEVIPQGVFSGRGGVGVSAALSGVNGSVTAVTARQIAAIAAAMDTQTKLFAAASKVSAITADAIGYDVNRNKAYDNVNGSNSTPDVVQAIDGFIFSQTALVNVIGSRAGFVFAPLK